MQSCLTLLVVVVAVMDLPSVLAFTAAPRTASGEQAGEVAGSGGPPLVDMETVGSGGPSLEDMEVAGSERPSLGDVEVAGDEAGWTLVIDPPVQLIMQDLGTYSPQHYSAEEEEADIISLGNESFLPDGEAGPTVQRTKRGAFMAGLLRFGARTAPLRRVAGKLIRVGEIAGVTYATVHMVKEISNLRAQLHALQQQMNYLKANRSKMSNEEAKTAADALANQAADIAATARQLSNNPN